MQRKTLKSDSCTKVKVIDVKILRRMFLAILLFCLVVIGLLVHDGYNMYEKAITEVPLTEKIVQIKSKENYAKIEELPEMYIDAVISVEDHRFYLHNGIDVISILRAIIKDIQAMEFIEGGSTITQQLAKNIYFTQEKEIRRKIAEVFMAFEIEKSCSKNEILELYLNTCYFGDGYYTVKEACRGYFNKELSEMTDYECVLLAGIPNAPSIYAPTKNPELARQRQKQVIDKMVKYGCLTNEEAYCIANATE